MVDLVNGLPARRAESSTFGGMGKKYRPDIPVSHGMRRITTYNLYKSNLNASVSIPFLKGTNRPFCLTSLASWAVSQFQSERQYRESCHAEVLLFSIYSCLRQFRFRPDKVGIGMTRDLKLRHRRTLSPAMRGKLREGSLLSIEW